MQICIGHALWWKNSLSNINYFLDKPGSLILISYLKY